MKLLILLKNSNVLAENVIHISISWSQDSSVDIRKSYGLDAGIRFHSIQIGPGAHPASYPMHIGGCFPGPIAVGS
jgi:hypothetical protein